MNLRGLRDRNNEFLPLRSLEQAKADIEAQRAHMKAVADCLARRLQEKRS